MRLITRQRLLAFVPQRLRGIAPEAVKFGIVGGLNTIINFVVLNALILSVFPDGQLKANVIATAVAMTASFLLNRHWTYRDRPNGALHREFVLFMVFNVAGLAIELAVMGATKYWLGLTSLLAINVAKLLGLVLGTIFRFVTYRTFVFVPAQPAAARTDAAEIAGLTEALQHEINAPATPVSATKRARPAPARIR